MSAPQIIPPVAASAGDTGFRVELAASPADLEAAERLRYMVFADDLRGRLPDTDGRLDTDYLVPNCHHLLVREPHTGELVACTRILTEESAPAAGGFYALSRFELGPLMNLPGKTLEIGGTCVRPDSRQGAAINALWYGLARFMTARQYQYLMSCASLPLTEQTPAQLAWLRLFHRGASRLRVTPRRPLPNSIGIWHGTPSRGGLPPLLKASLRLGARICGEACHDPDFNVADLLVLLDVRDLPYRYHRHFLGASAPASRGATHDGKPAGIG